MKKFMMVLSLILLCTAPAFAVACGDGKGDALRELRKTMPETAVVGDNLYGTIEVDFPTKDPFQPAENANEHYMDQYYYSTAEGPTKNKINRIVQFYSCDCCEKLVPGLLEKYGKPIAEGIYTKTGEKIPEEQLAGIDHEQLKTLLIQNAWEERVYWEEGNEFILLYCFDTTTYLIRGWKTVYKNTNSNKKALELRYLTAQP